MSLLEDEHVLPSTKDDFLVKEIILTHDHDDRQLDSETLLHLVESTFRYISENVFDAQFDGIAMSEIDLNESKEPMSFIINKISNEIISQCFKNGNLHRKTVFLLEMLSRYRWDAKVVIALASFAHSFGLFWLILQLQSDNALAIMLASVKCFPRAIGMLKPKFKAMNLLVNTMLKVAKIIVRFEGISELHELVDDKVIDMAKSKMYLAAYWILRSTLVCSSQVADSRNLKLELVYSDETVVAALALHSLGYKLECLGHDLEELVQICHHQTETRFYQKLLSMSKENQVDNQKMLKTLFALHNGVPFKTPTSQKCDLSELKNKVVILLISKPEMLPIEEVFLLVQQTYNHSKHKKFEDSYAIIWVPVASSCEWSLIDKASFEFLSSCLPWLSIRRPWSLGSTVTHYIKQEWNFKEDPIMVVLNENGKVTNFNAMDMVWIWGPKAFPFSVTREKELWEQENWTLDLMINGINPLLTQWVEEGRNLCIYGSDNLDWIREFNSRMTKIKSAGIQLEIVYVGCKNPGDNVKHIIDIIDQEKLCSTSLTFKKAHMFWLRLGSIKRSIAHQDSESPTTKILKKVEELLDCTEGWAVIGRGSSTNVIKLDSETLKECLELFPLWCKNVAHLGLAGAIRSALEPPLGDDKCHHSELIPYEEGPIGKTVICGLCKRPVEKFVLYKCDVVTTQKA